jgi:hypothetical protein
MLAQITYGTFLVFGSACIVMVVYAILCIPETKGKLTPAVNDKPNPIIHKLT